MKKSKAKKKVKKVNVTATPVHVPDIEGAVKSLNEAMMDLEGMDNVRLAHYTKEHVARAIVALKGSMGLRMSLSSEWKLAT